MRIKTRSERWGATLIEIAIGPATPMEAYVTRDAMVHVAYDCFRVKVQVSFLLGYIPAV